ncbi:hypothetical protein BYT27DRAFT_6946210 [Phlegmacium glaucopus]|nr:hypothetical protein BYT27DRAFT_6946210 [Phlegmacium glaucopus]
MMKFIYSVLALSAVISSVSAAPVLVRRSLEKRDVDPNLIPQFDHAAGLNPTGTGDCDGVPNAAGVPVKIPCSCPPDRNRFIDALNANVAAGHAVNNPSVSVSFPTDNSQASQLARIHTGIVTLQNLNGPGQGCPSVSTTFDQQAKDIQAGTPARRAPGVDPALVPEFDHAAGINPTGTGDCDGVTDPSGNVIKIPCSCPPDRNSFIQSLNDNVNAGHAVNNPSISVSFPTDDSKASKLARVNAALVTLQNLRGPGAGCPASSTTFVAQQAAIQNS